jgi:hypothetical protein
LQRIYPRYQKASRPEKEVILDEFCANCSYHRKHAIRLLNRPRPAAKAAPRRRARSRTYGPQVISVLKEGLASSRLSLIGALESFVAGVDALDPPPVPAGR